MRAVVAAGAALMPGMPALCVAQTVAMPAPDVSITGGSPNLAAQAAQAGNEGVRFVWREHPSLRFGRALRLDFQLKVQEDARDPGDDPEDFDTWELHRLRWGIDGELFNRVQFSVERELYERENDTEDDDSDNPKSLWKDVYVDANISTAFQVRGGRFKIPFGLEQLTGISNLDFVYRSQSAAYLAPSRDVGVALHGRVVNRRVNYWIGGFKHDGDNSKSRKIAGGDETIMGRVTTTLWNQTKGPGFLEVSAALGGTSVSDEPVLPNGLRGRTVMSQFDFYEPVFVKGRRTRFEADVDWMRGPFSTRAEYTWMSDDRHEQGFGSDDLPQARARGFYVSGTAVVTGERKDRPVEPRRRFGAVEVAARFERIRFAGVPGDDPPFRNPRAETIYPVANEVTTLGLNWYVNRFFRVRVNTIREQIDDVERSPVPNGTAFWSQVLRLQLGL
jgi:phosphate-selective porin OprO/OprP